MAERPSSRNHLQSRRFGISDPNHIIEQSKLSSSLNSQLNIIPALYSAEEGNVVLTMNEKRERLKAQLSKSGSNSQAIEFAQTYLRELVKYATNRDAARSVILKAVLGKFLREMLPGQSFGERALECNAARSASVVTLDDCHFLTLSAEEYNQFIRNKHKILKEAKQALLHDKFPGYSSLPGDETWEFQYLFQVG